MNFAHITILAGLATISIPLLLHMLGRRQPKLIDFPALRFVRQTQLDHSKSWQLRHFLLLLLRVLLLAVLVFALARPRVHSAAMGSFIGIAGLVILATIASLAAAIAWASRRPLAVWVVAGLVALGLWIGSGVWGYRAVATGPALPTSDTTAPIAAAIILDTSPSMSYVSSNQTRLQAAKEMAEWILNRMPTDSHVGVLTGVPIGSLSQSPQGANTQISRIDRTTQRIDLLERLRVALDLVLDDPLERREIYILTDMNSAAWGASKVELLQQIEQVKDQVLIQLVDLSASAPINWQLGDPIAELNTVPVDGDVAIKVPVTQITGGTQNSSSVTVELWQEAVDPRLPIISGGNLQLPESKVVARKVIDFTSDTTVEVELVAKKLPEGMHHFTIKLDRNDPLQIDNQRYISITAKRQQPTLIVSNSSDASDVLHYLLDPSNTADSANNIAVVTYAQLAQAALTRFSVVVLYDPVLLPAASVQALREHVVGGGGLMIILSRSLESSVGSLDNSPLIDLLPGKNPRITSKPKTQRQCFWNPTAGSHPVYQDLETQPAEIAWQLMPIYRYWQFSQLKDGVQVLATVSNDDAPLLTSQNLGQGQILTLTTPLPEFEQLDGNVWNDLWITEQYWASFGVLSGCLKTLSGANQLPSTFVAGATVTLANDTVHWPKNWEMYTPPPRAERLSLQANGGVLATGIHSDVGVYHLRGNRGGAVSRGFSINIEAADTSLQRIETNQLDNLLGANCYHIAKRQDEIESSVGNARFGQELFPLLMLFVAGIFLAEQVMSNRFYKIQFRIGKATA